LCEARTGDRYNLSCRGWQRVASHRIEGRGPLRYVLVNGTRRQGDEIDVSPSNDDPANPVRIGFRQ
jgi:hypothetical protein